jgi:UMF1 family MFS transporter
VADYSRSKKKFLFINCYITIIFTGLLYFVGKGDVMKGMIFFIIANYGFNSANVFYDAFLPEITKPEEMGKVSGYGWALGYVGGLISLFLALILVKVDVRLVFPAIALYFFIFSLITMFWLKELRLPSKRTNYFKTAFQRIAYSYSNIRKIPELLKFLMSYFIYNDGITTVIVFASIYGIKRFGMTTQNMIIYFIIAQISSILGSGLFGYFTDRIGVKKSLSISLLIWIAVVIWAFFCSTASEYYYVGLLAGLAIGSSQSNSRTLLAMLTPQDKRAEFFGFYTLTGRISSIFGPIIYGEIARRTGSQRWSILSLILFFTVGFIILQSVRVEKGMRECQQMTNNVG